MVLVRSANDPLERCGQGIGCGKFIDEVGFCVACQQRLLSAVEAALKERTGLGLIELIEKLIMEKTHVKKRPLSSAK